MFARHYNIWIIAFLMISVFPFLYLARYNVPLSDEFIAMHYRSLLGQIGYQKLLITAWSGRYTANLLESIYPATINIWFYRIVPVLVIVSLYLSIYAAIRHIFFGNRALLSGILLVLLINFIPSPGDLIYYTPAIIIYSVSFILLLIILSIAGSGLDFKIQVVGLIFLELLLMGTSETYIPLILMFSTLLMLQGFIKNHPIKGLYLVNWILVCCVCVLLISVTGNQTRLAAQKTDGITHGIYNYIHSVIHWTIRFLPALPFLLYIVLTARELTPNDKNISSKIPSHISYYAIAGYLALFTPLLFIDLSSYKRLGNVFFFYFLILSTILILKSPRQFNFLTKTPKIFIFLLIVLFIFCGNIFRAYRDMQHGYSKVYSKNLENRYLFLEKNRGSKTVIMPAIPRTDYILSIQDVNSKEDSLVVGLYNPLQLYFEIDTINTN